MSESKVWTVLKELRSQDEGGTLTKNDNNLSIKRFSHYNGLKSIYKNPGVLNAIKKKSLVPFDGC